MLGERFSRVGSCCRPWHARRLDGYAEAVFRHCRENEPDLRRIEQGAAWSCCYRRYRSMTEKPLRAAYDGVGSGVFSYDASRMFAYAVDLPIAGQAVRASVREPFLALVLRLDPYRIAELALKVFPHGVGQLAANHPVRSATRAAEVVAAAEAARAQEPLAQLPVGRPRHPFLRDRRSKRGAAHPLEALPIARWNDETRVRSQPSQRA